MKALLRNIRLMPLAELIVLLPLLILCLMLMSCATYGNEARCVTYRRYNFMPSEHDTPETLRGYDKLDRAMEASCN